MFIKLFIISAVSLITSFILLGIRILVKSKGEFPETHISRNIEMQKRGITCAQDTDTGCVPSDVYNSCSTCGKRLL